MRRSAAETFAVESGQMVPGDRLAAPDDLTADELVAWEKIIGATTSGWLTAEHEPLLRELCRHVVFARRLGVSLERMTEASVKWKAGDSRWAELYRLMRAHGYQTERISHISHKLRLTKQAKYPVDRINAKSKKTTAAPKPWEDWGDGVTQ